MLDLVNIDHFPVEVTQEHIDNGKTMSLDRCPVAHALLDATGRQWLVNRWGARLLSLSETCFITWSDKVTVKIANYDYTLAMVPFEFKALVD